LLGYSVFYDIEEMHPGEFEPQIFGYIDSAKDVVVLIEDGSLDSWKLQFDNGEPNHSYKTDWFYREVSYSLLHKKNIIPIWINCSVPDENGIKFFPAEVEKLVKLQAPNFSLYHVESSVEKLISKGFIKSKSNTPLKGGSVFKLYANNKDCKVYSGKDFIGRIEIQQDEPLYWCVERKGQYRFKCISDDGKIIYLDSLIDSSEEKIVDVKFPKKKYRTVFLFSGLVAIILIFGVVLLNMLYVSSVPNQAYSSGVGGQMKYELIKKEKQSFQKKIVKTESKDINKDTFEFETNE
jgi:hypothetical protein